MDSNDYKAIAGVIKRFENTEPIPIVFIETLADYFESQFVGEYIDKHRVSMGKWKTQSNFNRATFLKDCGVK